MSFEPAIAIADAVLMEGYLLYPYRASATKNRFRWTFGVLAPREWSEAGGCESWWMETQCLVAPDEPGSSRAPRMGEGDPRDSTGSPRVNGRLRFLHRQERVVEARDEAGAFREVEELEVEGAKWMAFDEGSVTEHDFELSLDHAKGESLVPLRIDGGEGVEDLRDAAGSVVGSIRRRRWPIEGVIRIRWEPVEAERPLLRLEIRVENQSPWSKAEATREEVLRSAFISTHVILRLEEGAFVSLLDPPEWAREAVGSCTSVGAHPVLATEDDSLLLASPFILYDHPKIAPESPGDLFDGTEIDEILTLRTLLLTDEEKREARATDPRAAAIVDRTESLPPEAFAKLHGTFRDLRNEEMVPKASFPPGSLVRLRPGARRTDAQDLLYVGKVARVEKSVFDLDGRELLAVTIEGDPAAEFHRWYGRFHYYGLDEVEPIEGEGSGR